MVAYLFSEMQYPGIMLVHVLISGLCLDPEGCCDCWYSIHSHTNKKNNNFSIHTKKDFNV